MGSIVPTVQINESWHKILLENLDVTRCRIDFIPVADKDDQFLVGTYNASEKKIEIRLHRNLVGRRMTENKKKKVEGRILETLLHEYRHHWQYTHAKELVKSSVGVDYYKKPIEIDARSFAKSSKFRYKKLISISKGESK